MIMAGLQKRLSKKRPMTRRRVEGEGEKVSFGEEDGEEDGFEEFEEFEFEFKDSKE